MLIIKMITMTVKTKKKMMTMTVKMMTMAVKIFSTSSLLRLLLSLT